MCYQGKLILSTCSLIVLLLLNEFHNSPIRQHQGVLKTYQRLSKEVYWPGMKAVVRKFVTECVVCQQAKYLALAPAGLLQAFSLLELVWEDISKDLIEGLPKAHKHDTVLVVVVSLSKYAHFIPLKHPFTVASCCYPS